MEIRCKWLGFENFCLHFAENVAVFHLLDLIALLFVDDEERDLHATEIV